MRKPNFFIVGAPKCGTTAMDRYLGQHPDIFMSERKESHYFARDLTFRFDPVTEREYFSYFTRAREEKRIGEASVMYLLSKVAAREIKAFSPDAKIIIMLRNPIDVLYSMHAQLVYNGMEEIEDFSAALAAEDERKKGLRIAPSVRIVEVLFYSEIARFAEQTERYLTTFGPENVQVIIFDDFKTDTSGTYRKTLEFLQVDPDFAPEFTVVNPNKRVRSRLVQRLMGRGTWARSYKFRRRIPGFIRKAIRELNTAYVPRPPMGQAVRDRLRVQLAPEMVRLSRLLGRDLEHWWKQP